MQMCCTQINVLCAKHICVAIQLWISELAWVRTCADRRRSWTPSWSSWHSVVGWLQPERTLLHCGQVWQMAAVHWCHEKMRRMPQHLPIHMWILCTLRRKTSSPSRHRSVKTVWNLQIDICSRVSFLLQVRSNFDTAHVKALLYVVAAHARSG